MCSLGQTLFHHTVTVVSPTTRDSEHLPTVAVASSNSCTTVVSGHAPQIWSCPHPGAHRRPKLHLSSWAHQLHIPPAISPLISCFCNVIQPSYPPLRRSEPRPFPPCKHLVDHNVEVESMWATLSAQATPLCFPCIFRW